MGVRNGTYEKMTAWLTKKLESAKKAAAKAGEAEPSFVTVTAADVAAGCECDKRAGYNALQHGTRGKPPLVKRTKEAVKGKAGRPSPVYRYPAK